MIFGMTPLTFIHVLLSLIGIFAGAVVLVGLLSAKPLEGWTKLFLSTTVLTSVTGFFFPFVKMTPGIILGVIHWSRWPLPSSRTIRSKWPEAGGESTSFSPCSRSI